ncbi:MAG: Ig-like domain-containing protein [Mariniphaga sp.]
MRKIYILFVFFCFIAAPQILYSKVMYVIPGGSGNGTEENSPSGRIKQAINNLQPGDTLILLDGEYTQPLVFSSLKGTADKRITIRAKNICGAFINAKLAHNYAVEMYHCEYINIEGIKAGNTLHTTWRINHCKNLTLKRCAGFNAGYLICQDGHYEGSYKDNCHIFGIAYSDNILAEDIWAWGTGRYDFVYFQCTNSILRRGVFRPVAPELGYGYDRGPHSGFNLYDCDNCIAENCIAFECRFHPEADQAPDNPWGLVMGGMVFDDHTDPAGYNYVLGCFDLDNGNSREDVPRSNPAVHLMSKWSGKLEDVVIWKNALNYGIVVGKNTKADLPERALIGSPTRIRQNNALAENLNYRYVNGELTGIALWPWPYEDIIKEQMGMEETITEYVNRMVSPHLKLRITQVNVEGINLSKDSVHIKEGKTIQLTATVSPADASNRTVTWSSSDTTVAHVNEKGIISAVENGEGTATITATTVDGSFSAECLVIVESATFARNIKNDFQVEIYPNPVNGNGFTIQSTAVDNFSYEITDLAGQVVYRRPAFNRKAYISAETFKPGIYLVRVSSENKSLTKKIIIQ